MSVVHSYQEYFQTVREFNSAPAWKQDLLLQGTILTKCLKMKPVSARHRLRQFWERQAALRGITLQELQTWT